MADLTSSTLPVLPLTQGVVLPQLVVTIGLETAAARAAAEAATDGGALLLVPQVAGRSARVGVIASIEDRGQLPDGTPALVVRAERRALVGAGVLGTGDALWVQADTVDEQAPTARTEELAREYRAAAAVLLERLGGRRMAGLLRDVDSPGALADSAGWWPDLAYERKVELLETIDVDERLERVTAWVKEALAEGEVADRIRAEVAEGMEKTQREFLLRQQLAAIRKELGEGDEGEDLIDGYRAQLAERDLPEPVRDTIEREISRLERTSEQAAEHGWIRTWLDTILEVPWGERSDDDLDLGHARAVLDADHTGLDEVKDRIVEELAVRKLRLERHDDPLADTRGKASIIALVGPPGVGKTSLGESVARALGRQFVRVALGGVRDEAEIRGHRRTYVGARPGRIVRAITEAGTMNPVFLLDEIDKVGSDWRGDPSSALLEVLDPAQNHSFRDHYLEVDLDLSSALFIATANVLDTIPAPLLDRMEVITLDGYTDEEKVAIARDHLLARQLERNGLEPGEVALTDDAYRALVSDYTREAGVRGLERQLGKLLRKAATRIATGDGSARVGSGSVVLDVDDLRPALGRPRFHHDEANRAPTPGVVNGLAVTGAGGDVLIVEATAMEGDQSLKLTGQLGDVMSESGDIALSFIRAHREELGIDADALDRRIHVHFPAGAVPKDGPSAGVTMTTALVSLLSGRPVRPSVAMTGEVTLQGNVLPIGGVKQKLLAAHRAGITDVVIPARNEPDLDDLPASVLDELTVHPVSDVREVLELALV
ncbi:MAG TPA: endopeptidase La [Acidimicrobiales bacterium]|nr:endopeptidase La [Acidimicrobiales bacterium]